MITSLRLQNFRSYIDESFEFEPGVNIVVGPNASGKTNLLEAILVVSAGSSYRAKDQELINHQKAWSRLEGYFGSNARVLKIKKINQSAEKSFLLNGKSYKRLNLERVFPVVLFEPNHLQLITKGPDQRRDYIDNLLERTLPGFKSLAASYRRALSQRNAALKRGPAFGKQQLFAWNVRLSELGEKLAIQRSALIEQINKGISRSYSNIAKHSANVELQYVSPFAVESYASRLLSMLERKSKEDFERGYTAYGPHREDINFLLNGQLVGNTASRGETRSLILGLKIFELQLIGKLYETNPILLLDDVFSELDGARRHALVDYLKNHQTIITTTDAEAVLEYFSGNHNLISLQRRK